MQLSLDNNRWWFGVTSLLVVGMILFLIKYSVLSVVSMSMSDSFCCSLCSLSYLFLISIVVVGWLNKCFNLTHFVGDTKPSFAVELPVSLSAGFLLMFTLFLDSRLCVLFR